LAAFLMMTCQITVKSKYLSKLCEIIITRNTKW